MKFIELSKDEFLEFSKKTSGSFYQSYAWAKIKEANGWNYCFVGVIKDDSLVAAGMVLGKVIYLNKYLYYAPRGVFIDYYDKELLGFFTREIKKFLIKRNGILFKMDPLVIYRNHDRDGNVIDGPSGEGVIDNLLDLGYIHHGFTKGYNTNEIQIRWSYILDITGSIDDIISGMDHRCRRCLRKSEKYPLELVFVDDDNKLNDFKGIMQSTAVRQNHFDRTIGYYNNLNNLLGNKSILATIYLDRDRYLKECINDKLYDIILKDDRKMIPISAGVFIFDNDRLNYVYGGTYSEYMSLMAQYKMQMDMIKIAKEKKVPIYDFGGISGDFDPSSAQYGVYEFKRGFGGNVIEYIGEFDLILDKFGYFIYNIGYKLYRNIKKLVVSLRKI